MKTEQENWNTGFYTGFKQILTDLVIIMCKTFSIDNIVSTPAVFMNFFFLTIKQLLNIFKLWCERKI